MNDSLFVHSLLDSTRVAGWLAPLAAHIPGALRPYLIGLLVWFIVDAAEELLRWFKTVPVFGHLFALWQEHSRVISPLIALAVGVLGAGNPLAAVIAAGLRSMTADSNVITKAVQAASKANATTGGDSPPTPPAAPGLGAVALLLTLGLALFATSARAESPRWTDASRFKYGFGATEQWRHQNEFNFRALAPTPYWTARMTYAVTDPTRSKGIALQMRYDRGFSDSREQAVSVSLLLHN